MNHHYSDGKQASKKKTPFEILFNNCKTPIHIRMKFSRAVESTEQCQLRIYSRELMFDYYVGKLQKTEND